MSTRVSTTDAAIEPRQPKRLEKKKNTPPLYRGGRFLTPRRG